MKAVVYRRYGSPEVLELADVDKPIPRENEVLIRVHAVSINEWDRWLLQGDLINRVLYGFLRPKQPILGSDVAGRIEAVGAKVTRFKPGDDVYGDLSGAWGGFAEYVCAPESALVPKPPRMSFEEAAALPQTAMLAIQGLIDRGRIRRGQRVLINGAGGGIGTFAVQLAKLYEAEVICVDRPEKLRMLLMLGADEVIDCTQEDFTGNGARYDLILDIQAQRPVYHYIRVLRSGGVFVALGGSSRRLVPALLLGPWIAMKHQKHVRVATLRPTRDLATVNRLYEAGKVKPVIEVYNKLGFVPDAIRRLASGQQHGEVVVSVRPGREMIRE
jgi:NADPH:quinone reductase-like Zn-dependent oxidoreductase